jgi:DNA-binding MarR family transcriptional regulator
LSHSIDNLNNAGANKLLEKDLRIQKIFNQLDYFSRVIARNRFFFYDTQLTFPDFRVLKFISTIKKCSITDVSNHFYLAPSTASGIVERLVNLDLVSRERDEEVDRRKVIIKIKENGSKKLLEIDEEILSETKKVLSSFSEEDQEELIGLLEKLVEIFEKKAKESMKS